MVRGTVHAAGRPWDGTSRFLTTHHAAPRSGCAACRRMFACWPGVLLAPASLPRPLCPAGLTCQAAPQH